MSAKKFSWLSIVIGLLSGIGIAVLGALAFAFVAAGFGATPASLRVGKGLPFLARAFMMVVSLVICYGSGYVSSFVARPHGIYNAVILGIVYAALTFDASFWGLLRMGLSLGATIFGGISVKQTAYL